MSSSENQKTVNSECKVTDPDSSNVAVNNEFKTNDDILDPIIRKYIKWEKIKRNIELVKTLVQKNELTTLRKMLLKRLEMSGGSIKGEMTPGFNGINDLVVIQTGQGLMNYLETVDMDNLKECGIVIGYDGRNNSKRYSELIATIFLSNNYPVKLFSKEVITPFVPCTVTKYDCVAGVMISGGASSKNYNGITIFSSNGCQAVPPIDSQIEKCILENLEPAPRSWNTDILEIADPSMLADPYEEILETYIDLVSKSIINEYKTIASKSTNKYVFTALHGVSYEVFNAVVHNHCLMTIPVSDQIDPDPNFPTVKCPNPKDLRAMKRAIGLAQRKKIKYIIGVDPDGSRMFLSKMKIEYDDNKTWRTFDGNELGALFGWWVLDQYKKKNEKNLDLKKVYMIASSVSSKILKSMARVEKFNFVETLPGFRWIANKAYNLQKEGNEVIFCFDDDYSYMFTDKLFDKDGVIASVQIMTMISYLNSNNLTLEEKLDQLYTHYGYHIHIGSYFKAPSYELIEKIFDDIRHYKTNEPKKPETLCDGAPEPYEDPYKKTYPRSVGVKFNISHVQDVTIGFDNNEPSRQSVFPVQPNMQMITFGFRNGIEITIRTNPKEAKLIYCAHFITRRKDMSVVAATRLVNDVMHKLIRDFINPTKNGLSLPRD